MVLGSWFGVLMPFFLHSLMSREIFAKVWVSGSGLCEALELDHVAARASSRCGDL